MDPIIESTGAETGAPAIESAPELPQHQPGSIEDTLARFEAGELGVDVTEDAPAAEPAADPAGEQAGAELDQDEDDDPPAPPPATDEAEAAEAGDDNSEEGEPEAAEAEAFVLALPGRREGDADVEIELTGLDAPARERLAQLRNGFMRGEEVRTAQAQIQRDRDELATIRSEFAADPAGFLLGDGIHPSVQKEVALALLGGLMETEAYDEVVDTLNEWESDEESRGAWQQHRQSAREQAAVQNEVNRIEQGVTALVPEGTPENRAKAFTRIAMQTVFEHVQANRLEAVDPAELPSLLADVMTGYGFAAPSSTAAVPPARDATAQQPPAKAPASAAPTAEELARARQTGQKLVKASARRREATAVAPAGHGAATSGGLQPPKGLTVEQTLDWFAKQ
jgi:hypothetical protein